jgi:hypothetical protein
MTLAEQQQYEEQKRKIIELDQKTRSHLEEEYKFGLYCMEVRKSGLWARDPANQKGDFASFLARVAGRKASRSTFDRRVRLVEHYTLERALELHAAGVDLIAMVECTYGAKELHPHLLEIALRGVPIWQIVVARRAGNQRLKEARKKKAKARARQVEGTDPTAEAIMAIQQALVQIQQELAEERARKGRKGKKGKKGREGEGSEDEGEDGEAALLAREAEVRERERAVALREQDVAQKMEAADKKAAELELERERLQLRAEVGLGALGGAGGVELDAAIEAKLVAVKGEQTKLAEQQAQLKEDRKKLAQWQVQTEQLEARVQAAQAEAEAAREAAQQIQRELTRRLKEAEAVAARLAEVEERERVASAQAADVAQREQGLAAQLKEIEARLSALGSQEAQIGGRLQEVQTREELLQTELAALEADRQKMREVWEALSRRNFEVERKGRYEGKIQWEYPWTMDDALNQMAAYFFQAMRMGIYLKEQHQKGNLPLVAGLSGILEAAEGFNAAKKALNEALPPITEEYERRFPGKAKTALARWKAGTAAAELPLHKDLPGERPPDIDGAVGKGRCPYCGGGGGGGNNPGGGGTSPSGGGVDKGAPPAPVQSKEPPVPMVDPAVVLGTTKRDTPQLGLLGVDEQGRPVGLCGNEIQSILICGQQNFGKSVTAQLIGEMLADEQGGVSKTPRPLAVMVAHYDHGGGYPSSFAKILGPNPDPNALSWLRKTFGVRVRVKGAKRLKIYVPPNLTPRQMEQRRKEYPGAEVIPLRLNMASLKSVGIRLIMGAVGNDALYIKKLEQILAKMGDEPTLEKLDVAIEMSDFLPRQRQLIKERIDFLRDYVTDGPGIVADLRPGDIVIFDLRHDFLDKDTALALFAVLMDAHAEVTDDDGQNFNKVMIFDEAHKFMSQTSPIREQVANAIKEMRHRHTWVIIATQDPRCVPKDVSALSSIMILHRISDRDMLKELQKRNVAWEHTTIERLATLGQAEAEVVTNRCTDPEWVKVPHRVKMRPPCTAPGGSTRTAV